MIISVIGEGDTSPEVTPLAEQVGKELADRGITLLCGGGGGVMEAACRGAKTSGGITIGILPGSNPNEANAWIDIPVCTGLGNGRNVIVVKSGSAVIAIGGKYGTLSEIGHALSLNIPVIGLGTWAISKNRMLDPSINVADNATDAVDKAVNAAHKHITSLAKS